VVAPIIPDHDFEQVLPFARALVERLAAADPAHLTARMSKALRPERIFIDYLRNAHGATAVAAYSTRARPGGPLSVPLRWDELTDRLDTAAFTIATVVPHRLDALAGTDPWEGFAESRTRLDATMFAALGVPLQISLEDR
jgi:bifunctional non-homologous end joining protein LigD